jgi:hypothetical protein
MLLIAPILIAIAVAGFFLSALCLWLPARWLGGPSATYRRALLVVALMTALAIVTVPASLAASQNVVPETSGAMSLGLLALGVIQLLINIVLIQRIFSIGLGRALAILVLYAIVNGAAAVGVVILLKTVLLDAHLVPTNAMAPTVVGWHRTGSCPHCKGVLIVPAPSPEDRLRTMFR